MYCIKNSICVTGLFLSILTLCTSVTCIYGQQLKVITYNVRNCNGMDNRRDYERIANIIRKESPDVVALQELDSVTQRNGGIFALKTLEEKTKMYGIYASAIPLQGGSYGIGILSAQKPLNYKCIPMPGREEKRAMIIAEFPDYIFCSTHQSLTPTDQVQAAEIIIEAVKSYNKPVIMAGDMNAIPSAASQQKLFHHFTALNDTMSCTYPADNPKECIDYIYGYTANGFNFDVKQQMVLKEPIASDHRPVYVNVKIVKKTNSYSN